MAENDTIIMNGATISDYQLSGRIKELASGRTIVTHDNRPYYGHFTVLIRNGKCYRVERMVTDEVE